MINIINGGFLSCLLVFSIIHGKITIPRPEFIVLYNGEDKYPDENTLKLSDMFAEYEEKCPIELELEVKVYNINKGHNTELVKKSVTLDGYEEFISVIRNHEKQGMEREVAITKAVKDCISRNVLKKFLETNSSEVINMLLTEWKMEDALRVREEEGMQKKSIAIARNMISMGIDTDTIAKATGLFIDDILRLKGE